jgi:hypothetical protein
MKPIYLILYAVLITLLLTLALPRLEKANPANKRSLWIAAIAGALILGVIMVVLTIS